jgi:hypothetical protein
MDMPRIVITMEGGVIQGIYSSDPLDAIVIDWDETDEPNEATQLYALQFDGSEEPTDVAMHRGAAEIDAPFVERAFNAPLAPRDSAEGMDE